LGFTLCFIFTFRIVRNFERCSPRRVVAKRYDWLIIPASPSLKSSDSPKSVGRIRLFVGLQWAFRPITFLYHHTIANSCFLNYPRSTASWDQRLHHGYVLIPSGCVCCVLVALCCFSVRSSATALVLRALRSKGLATPTTTTGGE
jgi:hypothetical protein